MKLAAVTKKSREDPSAGSTVDYVTAERRPRPPAPLVKRHIASAVNWLQLNNKIQKRVEGS